MTPEYKEVEKWSDVGYELLTTFDGTKNWYLNGERHREDGPAVEFTSGTKMWFLNGKQHREDGPAHEWADGDRAWYLHGFKVSEEEFKEVWECPLDRLPLYINTPLAPIMRRRLKEHII